MRTTFERRQAIIRILTEQPGIRTSELSDLLDVSIGTIRNDLNALQSEGEIRRVRGGAIVTGQSQPSENGHHTIVHKESKERIAKRAVEMVFDGDAIWLDAGTTVQMMVPLLNQRLRLTIVTNGLRVALELAQQGNHEVLLVGGRVGKDGIYTIGTGNEKLLETVNIRTAFISGVGLAVGNGLTVSEYEDAQLKTRIIEMAENVVALIDSTKIGKRGFAPFATFAQLTHLLTDKDVSPKLLHQLRRSEVNVTICGKTTIRAHTVRPGDQRIVVGFANQSEQLPFAVDVRRSIERVVATHGNVDLILSDNDLSSREALRVANHLIQRQVDIAIEYQIDHRSGNLIMDKFQRAGIPVIAVDIPMIGATFFGVDNYRAGLLAGEALGSWVLEQWDGEIDKLIILEEQRAGDLPKARIHGQQDALEEAIGKIPEEKIFAVDSGNLHSISQANMYAMLRAWPRDRKIAVISFNDEAAVGAMRAARALDRTDDVVIVGQGADRLGREEICRPDSRLIGSTAYMPERYGEKLIELAIKILQEESVPPAVYIDHVFITRDSVKAYYP
ncbi:MAG: substrate-binding domain-containing protein [Chloroflexota bacterium]